MPTRKDLHDRTRQEQRHRLQAVKADNPKSAIVGMGARDPQTGLYDVLLPDGSVEQGEKTFSSAIPTGNQVLGIPKEGGGWMLDERDAMVSPVPTVETEPAGKIKYLYSVLNDDNSRDLWLGGWQPKPVKLKAIATGEDKWGMRNTGGSGYWLDYQDAAAFLSLSGAREVYRFVYTVESVGIESIGYSFFTRPIYGAGAGDFPYWGKLFQGVFLGGLNSNATGLGHYYLLPNLISPKEFAGEDIYRASIINQAGTRGVGVHYLHDSATVITLSDSITETGVELASDSFLLQGTFDCFDDNFSAIDTVTFYTDVFSKPKFTGSVGIYDFNAIQQRTVKTTIYGIPAAQRSRASLIRTPSYHPRTTTLKP